MGDERLDLPLFESEGEAAPGVVVVLDVDARCDEAATVDPIDTNCACE